MAFGRRARRGREAAGAGERYSTLGSVDESIPIGMRLAAAWSWRLLVVGGALGAFVFLIAQLRDIVVPFLVAVLLAALLVPFARWLQRHHWPKWLSVALAEVGLLAIVTGLVFLVVSQVRDGFPSLRDRSVERYEALRQFLLDSPLHLTERDINGYLKQATDALQNNTGVLFSGALSVGSNAAHVLTGLLLTLFATLFILIDGRGIWNWVVRLFPRRARPAVNGAGEAGWLTLTTFVKVQIFVAFVDAVGIGLGSWVVGLFFGGFPLVVPIAVAVFLGSFVPVVGAVVTGALAVLVALIFNGPLAAVLVLGVVLLVQQVEGHVLQPLVMGTAVRVHPLAVVLSVAGGGYVAGIPGTLFAVPFVATLNVIISYIASGAWRQRPHPREKDVTSRA